MEITELTVHELREKIEKGELSVTQITQAYINNIKEKEGDIQAFITILEDEALKKAEELDEKIKNGEIKAKYAGIPIGIKDNICTKGIRTTCASKMLENFVSPYNATVVNQSWKTKYG